MEEWLYFYLLYDECSENRKYFQYLLLGSLNFACLCHDTVTAARISPLYAEDGMKAADRKVHLYSYLSEQFGEKGIWKSIINRAEVVIVRLSNQMLDNLSVGRSKLRLREAGGNKKTWIGRCGILKQVEINPFWPAWSLVHSASGLSSRWPWGLVSTLAMNRIASSQ
jgi:hypothetical protein